MTIAAKLDAVERALKTAKQNQLAIHATQDLGGVKREVRSLLEDSDLLRDLFPTRIFGRDEHASTDALVGALSRAAERIERMARDARDRAATAQGLLARARELQAAKQGKTQAKQDAVALLSTQFEKVYEEHVSFLRRNFRTEHAPSETLVLALRGALSVSASPQAQGPYETQLKSLLSKLDTLRTRTDLKAEINAFLAGTASGQADLRPRRLLRADHAPIADLIDLLERLRLDYAALSDPAQKQNKLDKVSDLTERLTRRRSLKTERDECLVLAKALKAKLRGEAVHARRLIERIADELNDYEERSAKLRREIEERADARWRDQLVLEQAARALELLGLRAEALEDELTLPGSFEALSARKRVLLTALASDHLQIAAARKLEAARNEYEDALARDLTAHPTGSLPDKTPLLRAQTELHDLERQRALAEVESKVLSEVKGDEELGQQLADAAIKVASDLKSEGSKAQLVFSQAQLRVQEHDAMLERLQDELMRGEVAIYDAVCVRRLCVEEHAAIDTALNRYHALKNEYRDTDALVYYISSSEDLAERLFGIARLLRGRRDSVDSMGSVRLALMIDAGVRAGVELGFLNLTGEVRVTLLLEGTLSVLDSREVMFQSHLAVFLSAEAKASAGLNASTEGAIDMLGAGDILPVPDLLLEASAKCKASLYDSRAYTVYADENHWAARWAHAVARRQAFVRRVKLTREGFETLNEAWLEAQVRSLASEGGALAFLSRLSAALQREPRELSLDTAQRVEGSLTAKAGEHEKTVGSDGGLARYTLFENSKGQSTKVCEVVEHSLEFVPKKDKRDEGKLKSSPADPPAPSNFHGTTVYHTLDVAAARPRARTEPRAYLEVSMIDAHALSLGAFKFESAGTSNSKYGSIGPAMPQRYRALAASLDIEANSTFERVIKLPKAFEDAVTVTGPPSAATSRQGAEEFARTARMRLDLLVARGEPRKLTRLLNQVKSFEELADEKLKTAAEKAEEAQKRSQRLGEILRTDGAELSSNTPIASGLMKNFGTTLARQSDQATELLGLAKEKIELIQESIQSQVAELKECLTLLDNSHAAYARYIRSFRCSAPEPATTLRWEPTWVAQVHRGLCRRRLRVSKEVTFDVLPLVKVFVGVSVDFESESSEFEALGLHTFSYLKSLATSMSDETSTAWWALHMGEIFDICEGVATPGSVPFSEVALDALEGRAELQKSARAFGQACWNVFRSDENPFAAPGFNEATIVKALQGKLAGTSYGAATPHITHAPVLVAPLKLPAESAAEAALTRRYLVPLRESLLNPCLIDTRTTGSQSFESLLTRVVAGLKRAKRLKQTLVNSYQGVNVERSWIGDVEAEQRLSELLMTFRQGETECLKRAAAVSTAGASTADRVVMARALMVLLEDKLTLYTRLEDKLTPELSNVRSAPLLGQGSDAVMLLADGLSMVATVLGEKSRVPTLDEWKRGSSITFLMRSGATEQLDRAVAEYHRAGAPDVGFDGKVPASLEHAFQAAAVQIEELQRQLHRAANLQDVVHAWYKGRDESTSRRAPGVAAVLELPHISEWRRLSSALAFLLLRIDMASRLDALCALHAGIVAAEERTAIAMKRTLQHRLDVKQAKEQAERLTETTVKLQRLFRARRQQQQQGGTSIEALKRCLLAYLRAAAPDFCHDQLIHGRKKTLLRGENVPMYSVAEPVRAES